MKERFVCALLKPQDGALVHSSERTLRLLKQLCRNWNWLSASLVVGDVADTSESWSIPYDPEASTECE